MAQDWGTGGALRVLLSARLAFVEPLPEESRHVMGNLVIACDGGSCESHVGAECSAGGAFGSKVQCWRAH